MKGFRDKVTSFLAKVGLAILLVLSEHEVAHKPLELTDQVIDRIFNSR